MLTFEIFSKISCKFNQNKFIFGASEKFSFDMNFRLQNTWWWWHIQSDFRVT